MPKTSTRKERKRELKTNYLLGKGRKSYTRRPTLDRSLEEDAEQPGPSGLSASGGVSSGGGVSESGGVSPSGGEGASGIESTNGGVGLRGGASRGESSSGGANSSGGESSNVCPKCRPVLSLYSDIFKYLTHHRSELKRRKHLNPHPKQPDMPHYHDLNRQNEWIRENVFDLMGNYLFCSPCIRKSLGVSPQRLCRQRAIKRKQLQEPLRNMTKAEQCFPQGVKASGRGTPVIYALRRTPCTLRGTP